MPARGAAQGGDWCETFPIGADVVALSIGDVCGHGAEAFQAMFWTRQALRDASAAGLDPAQTLAAVDCAILSEQPELYVTAIFGLLDTRSHTLVFGNAGHPPPLMAGISGERFLDFGDGDLLLGVKAAATRTVHVVKVPAETLLVLYTDGVVEYRRDTIGAQKRLREAATVAHYHSRLPAAQVIEGQMFLNGSNADDASILTARTPGLRFRNA